MREKSRALPNPEEAAETLRDLRDTLHEFRRTHGFGRGISAIQIGVADRVIYIEFEGTPWCLLNPEYESLSEEKFTLWDDCFSFPDLRVKLERSQRLRLRFMEENGSARSLEASGALSELIQHEMDHLDGVLAVDRALDSNSLCTSEEWLRRYR